MTSIYYNGTDIDLDDPALLLCVITTLREMGYRVEPTARYHYVGVAPGEQLSR